jgi:hypothetical protein
MKETCKCGKASMTYQAVGEDVYHAESVNTIIKTDDEGFGKVCICAYCKEEYDGFDPFIVTNINERYK